jgi:type II secretory pathway pseudopilin PulG
MSISPFSARPASPENERRRARLVLAIAMVGILATLLAYAISPGVRRDVRHAAHSVGHVLDRDKTGEHGSKAKGSTGSTTATPSAGSKQSTAPNK